MAKPVDKLGEGSSRVLAFRALALQRNGGARLNADVVECNDTTIPAGVILLLTLLAGRGSKGEVDLAVRKILKLPLGSSPSVWRLLSATSRATARTKPLADNALRSADCARSPSAGPGTSKPMAPLE